MTRLSNAPRFLVDSTTQTTCRKVFCGEDAAVKWKSWQGEFICITLYNAVLKVSCLLPMHKAILPNLLEKYAVELTIASEYSR